MAIYQGQDEMQRSPISNGLRVAAAILVCLLITIIPTATYTGVVGINTFLPKGIPGLTETSVEIFFTIMVQLTMVNSVINSLIYYLRNPKFKESLPTFGPLNCPSTEHWGEQLKQERSLCISSTVSTCFLEYLSM